MKAVIFAVVCIAFVYALPNHLVKRQATSLAYVLPDGVELVVGQVKTTFDCAGRIYGYYADVDNNCRVFHVCSPIFDDNNAVIDTAHYSFFCGNTTVFDQASLVCVHESDAPDCAQSPSLYDQINSEFGRIPPK